mmetsp:Transcript_914/g.1853  ORF Transcript_914/g.1853 Transcript_914/m.1853 type:complete len:154 (-) Transcript_914:2385-2846(-)
MGGKAKGISHLFCSLHFDKGKKKSKSSWTSGRVHSGEDKVKAISSHVEESTKRREGERSSMQTAGTIICVQYGITQFGGGHGVCGRPAKYFGWLFFSMAVLDKKAEDGEVECTFHRLSCMAIFSLLHICAEKADAKVGKAGEGRKREERQVER